PAERSEPMKLRSVMTVLLSAAVTAAATLLIAAPPGGTAQAGPALKPVIVRPQLTSQGCTFTVTTDRAEYEAGQSPAIEVTATNPTDKAVEAKVWVTVTGTAPVSPRSRMLPIPVTLWSHEFAFSLKPDEKKSLTATCDAKLPAGHSVAILLSDKKDAVM